MSDIFVFGASGHAKVVIDIIENSGKDTILFLVDDAIALKGKEVYGYQVLGSRDYLIEQFKGDAIPPGIIAIGSNRVRFLLDAWFHNNKIGLVKAVHPSVQLSRSVRIDAGTVVMAGVVINPDVSIGKNAIINTQASIDHECVIGNYAHIGPGAICCGNVQVGEHSMIGAGSTIIPNIKIGKNVIVGAGSTVIEDIPEGVTVVGSPARRRSESVF
ncbi:acetyltransferase [Deltaproteobacteria bacterium TL4]